MTLGPVSDLLSADLLAVDASQDRTDKSLSKVAAEFESLLLSEMLKSFREASSGGWRGESEDQAGATMMELAEQQLARTLAAQGGLGLQDLVVRGLGEADSGSGSTDPDSPSS